jgi:hypothetical protein
MKKSACKVDNLLASGTVMETQQGNCRELDVGGQMLVP